MRSARGIGATLLILAAALVAAACGSSSDDERLAAQRLFRNYLLQQDETAEADVRVQRLVDDLPPDFPLFESLRLLGSAFSDTASTRELIIGWESSQSADEIFDFYNRALDRDPWMIVRDPQVGGVDFLLFVDADNPAFEGELRIAQEGSTAVVLLIARERLSES